MEIIHCCDLYLDTTQGDKEMRITEGQLRKIIREEMETMASGGKTARMAGTARSMNRGRDLQDVIAYYGGDPIQAAAAMIRGERSFMDSRTHGPNAGYFLGLGKAAREEGLTADALAALLSA